MSSVLIYSYINKTKRNELYSKVHSALCSDNRSFSITFNKEKYYFMLNHCTSFILYFLTRLHFNIGIDANSLTTQLAEFIAIYNRLNNN